MAKKLSHDQKRKAKLKKRAERERRREVLPYTGDQYKTDRYAPIFFAIERGIHEAYVMLDRELTDTDVQSAIESLVLELRKGLPPVPSEEDKFDNAEVVVAMIRQRLGELADNDALPSRDDLIGVLRTLLNSIDIWSVGGARPQGYLHYIGGFMKKAGVSVRRVTEDLQPLPEPPEDPLLAIGRPWVVNGDEAAKADFLREIELLRRAGDVERALNVCQELLGEAEDESAITRLQSLAARGHRALEP